MNVQKWEVSQENQEHVIVIITFGKTTATYVYPSMSVSESSNGDQ